MRETSALDVLKLARVKIEDPKNWGKGRRHIDRPFETCCAAEAIEDSGNCHRLAAYRALKNAAGIDFSGSIVEWNDAPERSHSEVLAAFNLAIATLRLS